MSSSRGRGQRVRASGKLAELAALVNSEDDSDGSDAADPPASVDPPNPSLDMPTSQALRSSTREKRPPAPFHDEQHLPRRQNKAPTAAGRGRGRGRGRGQHVDKSASGDTHFDLPPTETQQQELSPKIVDLGKDKQPTQKDVDMFLEVVRKSLGWEGDWHQRVGGETLGSDGGPSTSAGMESCIAPLERLQIAKTKSLSFAKSTINGYRYELAKFLWFVESGSNSPEVIAWAEKTSTDVAGLSADLTTSIGRGSVPRFLRWIGDVLPGWYERPDCKVVKPPASAVADTIESVASALQAMYEMQCLLKQQDSSVQKLRDFAEIGGTLKSLKKILRSRRGINLTSHLDPQLNAASDQFGINTLRPMLQQKLNSTDLEDARGGAMAAFGFSTAARGDDARQLRLCAISSPLHVNCVGPSACFIIPVIIGSSKTNSKFTIDYKGFFRAKDPVICSIGWLSRYFFLRFVVSGEPFPNPQDPVAWKSAVLFAGKDATSQLNYGSHNKEVAKMLQSVDCQISSVTHSFRSAGAQWLEQQGLSLDKIQRMGNWANSVLEKTYLLFFTPDMVLAAGGHPGVAEKNYRQFWEPRYTLAVPQDFVEYLYPFITGLEATADAMEAKGLKIPSVRSMISSLRYIATVAWQDAIDIRILHLDCNE